MIKEKENEKICVVFDNGSDTIKAGYSGDKAPNTEFKSVVGLPKH